jgi:hypothetical protein
MSTSVDFSLSTATTTVFADTETSNKKVTTIVVSNETDDDTIDYTVSWSVGPQVLFQGTVAPEQAVSLIDGVYFMQEAGVEMTAVATATGLTLHVVYEDVV